MFRIKPVATSKPGLGDHYIKDAYKDISNYNKRRVDYFDDKTRWSSAYNEDYLKTVEEKNYKEDKKSSSKLELDKYEYTDDKNIVQMITDKSTKNEKLVRSK